MLTRRTLIAALALSPVTLHAGEMRAHDFSFPGIEGGEIRLADFAGRPVLVVNTASRCGFTYQYDGLQALYDRYRDRGLVVLGVPSDDFGGQELATEAEVKEFCEVNFGLDFPMTAITTVKGTGAHPFYAWARATLGAEKAPGWNFHKYLVAPDGSLVDAFPTRVEPGDPRLTAAIEALLPQG
ncbi:glutathione peroxidase [Limibaculum sp. FT325]|uniref:glutathione peroxidase n=1 Tax=Thermohalobaculum sediminis TaxID=2939436 RepID=UPI0020C08FC2|nr:glutathione peroxidase [Limibaculum sediminis]MCL5777355.1 glutathione peroxidase [Limibaculum sediminis]